MTSKEAVKRLSKYLGVLGCGNTIEEEYAILKDLKVLEILKKYLYIVEPDNEDDLKEFNTVDYLRLADYMTRKEYQVVKGWLENEWNNNN